MFPVQIVGVTVQRVNVSNFTVIVFVVENIVIHIASVSIAITETSSKIKDKKPLDLHLIETKMRSSLKLRKENLYRQRRGNIYEVVIVKDQGV